jgi:hypothetical protein
MRLVLDGHVFMLADGRPWTAIQCSDFNLFARFQSGQKVNPLLAQRADVGFNLLRVWTLYNIPNIGYLLDPDYDAMPEFLRLCAEYGLRVEFTAYTSTERPDHWNNLCAAVRDEPNVLAELGNELDLPVNRIDMSRYTKPYGVLSSHGSASSQTVPPWEPWDYLAWHTNGASEEQRKVGHNAMEKPEVVLGWHGPVIANETSRFSEVGMWTTIPPGMKPEDVTPDIMAARAQALAYDSAAGAALLCAGSCFHSVQGKTSVLWNDATLAAAQAWVAGARSVPISEQHEPYRRRDDLLTPELLRVYQRGYADEAIVRIRK